MVLVHFLRSSTANSLFFCRHDSPPAPHYRQVKCPNHKIGFGRCIEHLLFAMYMHENVSKEHILRLHLRPPLSSINFWPKLRCSVGRRNDQAIDDGATCTCVPQENTNQFTVADFWFIVVFHEQLASIMVDHHGIMNWAIDVG